MEISGYSESNMQFTISRIAFYLSWGKESWTVCFSYIWICLFCTRSFLSIFSLLVSGWVTGHFVPRSFRTQVISYHFGYFVPTFIFNLVISYPGWSFVPISYPVWSFCTFFYYFLENRFGHFVPIFLLFRTQVISYPKSFRTHFSHFVPRPFRTHFQLGTVRNDFFFVAVICFQTRYELTLVWNAFSFL